MSKFKTKKLPSVKLSPSDIVPEKPGNQPGSKKKLRIFVGIFLIIATITFWVAYAFQMAGNIKLSNNTGASLFQPLSNIFSESWFLIETTKLNGTTNILIAGIGGKWHEGSTLTDSLMLASLNTDEWYVTLLSIPRDLFVAYPKWYTNVAWRINSLYGMGRSNGLGVNLLASKIAEITGQSIDHYLIIDFSGFKQIVDTLGGIEIDVPSNLTDYQYPTDNWGYTTFSVRKWLQTFNGDTALKYARSRHSTSDFDRSERQQLLIKAIKNKALSAGFVTNPEKMGELFDTVTNNLDTDLTLRDISSFALKLKDIDSNHINIYNLSNDCVGLRCAAGAYLYNPSREYFWWASALIPENAAANKLSYYDDIKRFVSFIFEFPNMKNEKIPLNIVYKKGSEARAHQLGKALQKVGFIFDTKDAFVSTTGSINTSHINVYWNSEAEIGFSPDNIIVQAFKEIEDRIPYITVSHNEYVTTHGPRIEIILGEDSKSYFNFAKSAYYLPFIPSSSSGSSESGSVTSRVNSGNTISGEAAVKATTNKTQTPKKWSPESNQTQQTNTKEKIPNTPSDYRIAPGEWENF